jgi:hypothetical protein
MNLSQRLDQARSRRRPVTEPTAYELRMTRDAQVYDGRHLRTGEEMTSDQWEQLRAADRTAGLPAWNPQRANDLVASELALDLTEPGADVIDLRSRAPRSGDPVDVFEMPGWAGTDTVFRAEDE